MENVSTYFQLGTFGRWSLFRGLGTGRPEMFEGLEPVYLFSYAVKMEIPIMINLRNPDR